MFVILFNGIISLRRVIKSIFRGMVRSPSLHYGHTASYKIHQKLIENKLLPRSMTAGFVLSSSIQRERAIVISLTTPCPHFISFSIIFSSRKAFFRCLDCLTVSWTTFQDFFIPRRKRHTKDNKSLLFDEVPSSIPVTRWEKRRIISYFIQKIFILIIHVKKSSKQHRSKPRAWFCYFSSIWISHFHELIYVL